MSDLVRVAVGLPFRGECCVCLLCRDELVIDERTDPARSDWRALDLDFYRVYVCPRHLPPDNASAERFSDAYLTMLDAALEQIAKMQKGRG